MNEIIFFIQVFGIFVFAIGALKLGKSSLTAWVTIQALIANLFVLKQITLFGFNVTASDAFAIGSLLGLNFLQEHYGEKEAKQTSWICFFYMLFFVFVSQLHLLYQPNIFDTAQSSFEHILSPAPRLLFASMSIFFIVQQIDIRIFTSLKKSFPNLGFTGRITIALIITQFLDTILFGFVGLYGIVASVIDITIVSLAIKFIVIFCITPLLKLAKA